MTIDFDLVSKWLQLVLLISAVVGVFNGLLYFVLASRFAIKSDLADALKSIGGRIEAVAADKAAWRAEHEAAHRRLDEGFAKLSAELDGMATAEELGEVKLSVARVEGSVLTIGAKVDGVVTLLARIETPLNLLLQDRLSAGAAKS